MTRTVVVTGAAGGLGRAIVAELVSLDFSIVAADVNAEGLDELLARTGAPEHRLATRAVDLADSRQVGDLFDELRGTGGELYGLVNNAGTCLMSEFPDIPADELERQMAVNFSAAFHCCQKAIPLMLETPGVRKIVNISSNGAYNFDVFDPPHYRASKAALDTLTKDLARRYARDRIAVNSIAPAMTETPLFGVLDEKTLADAIAQMPHGAPMQPEQIAAWVGFLMSPAGDVASGNVIILNQGRDVR